MAAEELGVTPGAVAAHVKALEESLGADLFERYANGWTQAKAHRLASCTKSVTGFMLMTAVQDGLLKLDEKVAAQIEAGSDWIKVMATGGVFTPGTRARDTQFDEAGLTRVVRAAAAGARSVAAHCHGTEGIAHAVRAGVRTIEHASFAGPDGFGTALDPDLMREMADRELWVSPTVNAGWGRRIEDEAGTPTDFFRRLSACLRAQRAHGIRFIASTDAGIPGVAHHDLVAGLKAFARFADLAPVDALRAATSESARALGLENETGRIAPGLSADFLVLDADPLEDLGALEDPEWVVSRGVWWSREERRALAEGCVGVDEVGAS